MELNVCTVIWAFQCTDRTIFFAIFREFSLRKLQRIKANFMLLPRRHQEMLPNFNDHVKKVEKCIEENQNFLFNIVSHTNEMFENRDHTRISSVRCINYCFLLCPVYATQPFFYRVFCLRGEGVPVEGAWGIRGIQTTRPLDSSPQTTHP